MEDDETVKERRLEAERRVKARALRRLKAMAAVPDDPMQAAQAAGRLARTPTPCSCWMCGNPRRRAKGAARETVAEHRERLKAKDQE